MEIIGGQWIGEESNTLTEKEWKNVSNSESDLTVL